MSIVLSHPTGNEFFRAAAKGFYNAGELQSIYTSLASFPGTWLYKSGAIKAFNDIKRRSLDRSFESITHIHPWREAGRLLSIKLNLQKLIQHEKGIFSIDAIYKTLDKYVAGKLNYEQAKGASVIYAYEDGAAYSFKKAKALGMNCVYDLPIGYWRTMHDLLAAEKEVNPEWAFTLEGLKNSVEKLARKDQEIALSDCIIVASSFTAQSLKAYPQNLPKIHIIPYGFPPAREKVYRHFSNNDKLKVLFVGGLSQRKGLSYLFTAMKGFEKKVALTLVGRGSFDNIKILKENLAKHTWIESLPHHKILSLMRENDVLIFPSLFEGFGQVITEAMAQGTPVITTERTAGPDIIQHTQNGWLINAGSVDAIKNVLQEIIHQPGIIEATGKMAIQTATLRPWSIYESELAKAVNGHLSTVN